TGARLEVNVHIVTGSQSSTQNIVACVNRAGVGVAETIVEQLAASESVLTEDEKELGVALVDIGGGTSDIAIYERGSIWHTAVVGLGGDHFTNDIAVGLRTPVPDAEKVKRKCGCALSGMVDEDETMEVAGVGGLADHVNSPTFGTAVGLTLYAHRNRPGQMGRPGVGAGAFVRVAGRLRGLFREFF